MTFRQIFLGPSLMCYALLRGGEGASRPVELRWPCSNIPGDRCLSDEESSSCRLPGPLDTAHKVLSVLVVILLFVPTVVLKSE
jgi:hypothetical protein